MKNIVFIAFLFCLSCSQSQQAKNVKNNKEITDKTVYNEPMIQNSEANKLFVLEDDFELVHSSYEHFDNYKDIVIFTNQMDVNSLYTQLNMTRKPGLPIPQLDFGNQKLVLLNYTIADKSKNDIELTSLQENNGSLEISIKEEINSEMPLGSATNTPFKIFVVKSKSSTVLLKLKE